MPTYLIHGFRWSRPLVRIHIASYNLDDCCAEWLVAPVSIRTLLNNFYTNYDFLPPCQQPTPNSSHPSSNNSTSSLSHHSNGSNSTITGTGTGKGSVAASRTLKRDGQDDGTELTGFNAWSPVKVLEQHSEKSLVVSHPYAYIGDYVLPITLSADVPGEMRAYEQRQLEERERLQRETKIALDGFAPTSDSPPPGQESQDGTKRRKGPPIAMKGNGNGPNGASSGLSSGSSTPSRRPSIARLRRQERQQDWITQLRDKLQPSAEMGWYVVVVDDEERKLDEDYEPFEPQYTEVFPSKQNSAASQAGTSQPAMSQTGADDEHLRANGAESAMSSYSRAESVTQDNGDAAKRQPMKRRGSVARLRGLLGLKEKQRTEKESKWEGAAEWEKMQRKQREQADSSSVKQPCPPGWEKGQKGERTVSVNFSRPVSGNRTASAMSAAVERPGTSTGKLSKVRR